MVGDVTGSDDGIGVISDLDLDRELVVTGKVTDVRVLGSMVRLTLAVPGWRGARSGQFAMLRAVGSSRFLPRAFSVHGEPAVHPSAAHPLVSFLVSPTGPGTYELAHAMLHDEVAVAGPLGRGFDVDGAVRQATTGAADPEVRPRLLFVGGGVGVAPFLLPMHETVGSVRDAGRPLDLLLLFGFRDSLQAASLELFEEARTGLEAGSCRIRIEAICEDGSLGREGLVTALLEEELRPTDTVFCCGADAMCRAVWDVCVSRGAPDVWFSLEAGMACGVGSCQGCVLPAADRRLVRVCREGPVFRGVDMFGGRTEAPPEVRPEALGVEPAATGPEGGPEGGSAEGGPAEGGPA
jgi:dihydroorotate dehydrogenase electron transfer subunit